MPKLPENDNSTWGVGAIVVSSAEWIAPDFGDLTDEEKVQIKLEPPIIPQVENPDNKNM